MTKTVAISDFLTDDQITAASKLYKECYDSNTMHHFASRCAAEIIRPDLARINRVLTQENDAQYLAYAVMYAIQSSNGHG